MTEPRRLAQLPGYDTAPDVYETPDSKIQDGNEDAATSSSSTVQTGSSSRIEDEENGDSAQSDMSGQSDTDGQGAGLSRRRIRPSRARSRFGELSTRIQAKNVDWSDRVDGRRKGLGVRGRRLEDDEDEEEGLQARLARLKREIEECRIEAEREKAKREEEGDNLKGEQDEDEVEVVSKLLAAIEIPRPTTQRKQVTEPRYQDGTAKGTTPFPGADGDFTDEQTVSRMAAMDHRLASLEAALGSSANDTASGSSAVATPLLPTLTLLDQQLSALNSATSLSNLEALSGRIRALRADAQDLSSPSLHPAGDETEDDDEEPSESGDPSKSNGRNTGKAALSSNDIQTLRSLYSLLPTLQSLSPTVPALITRLRSLRTLHTSAAGAAAALDSLEQRQTELAQGLQTWRQGLEKVEHAIAQADEANGRNGGMVRGWVEDLEKRVTALGR